MKNKKNETDEVVVKVKKKRPFVKAALTFITGAAIAVGIVQVVRPKTN